jgi:hypothetical protein
MFEILGQFAQTVLMHAAASDLFNGNPDGVGVNLTKFANLCAHLGIGAGGTGTAKVQVVAAEDANGTNAEAIPFKYDKATVGDTFGALTDAVAADGVTTTAGTGDQYRLYVRQRQLPDGKPFVFVRLTEVVNDPVVAEVIGILYNADECQATMPTALT